MHQVVLLEQLIGVVEQLNGGLVGGIGRGLLEPMLRYGAQTKVAHRLHVGDRLFDLVLFLVGFVLLHFASLMQLGLFHSPLYKNKT